MNTGLTGMEITMNEIITRLNEIEERAGAILAAADEKKEAMAAQFEADRQEIDRKYERMLAQDIREYEQERRWEAERELAEARRRSEEELFRLVQSFEGQREALAAQIADRVTR